MADDKPDPNAGVVQGMKAMPVREMLRNLAMGIVDAQFELDAASIRAIQQAASTTIKLADKEESLLALGLIPTFYQFREATIDLSFSMSMNTESTKTLGMTMNLDYEKTKG